MDSGEMTATSRRAVPVAAVISSPPPDWRLTCDLAIRSLSSGHMMAEGPLQPSHDRAGGATKSQQSVYR